jgi:hypothetical protein
MLCPKLLKAGKFIFFAPFVEQLFRSYMESFRKPSLGQSPPVCKSTKYVFEEQLFFKKQATQYLPLLKAS